MLSRILEYSLKNRGFVIIFSFLLISLGLYSLSRVSLDALPDISNVIVEVNTKSGSLDPELVEKTITFFIETELSGIPGVVDIRSLSKFGLSNVVLTFEDGTDVYRARQIVMERLQNVKDRIPPWAMPELTPITTGLGEILMYSVTAKSGSKLDMLDESEKLTYLRTIQDLSIRNQIRSNVKNIAEVDTIGGYAQEIHIDLIPNKLKAQSISINEIINALDSVGDNFGGGYIEKNDEMIIARSFGSGLKLEELKKIPIRQNGLGNLVRVGDVAVVRVHGMQRLGSATHNGKEIVLGTVMMLMGSNSRETVSELKDFLDKIQLPEDVEINILSERSFLVNATIATIFKNLTEGALLVVLILFLALGNFRASIFVAIIIPLSMLFTAIGMYYFNISANLMSLGAIDFGLLVDAAIVMVENVLAKREELGDSPVSDPITFVLEASREILAPVTSGIIIVATVYVPILTLDGVEGKMFRPMAEAVLLALGGSYLITLLVIPTLCLFIVKGYIQKSKKNGRFDKIKNLYVPILLFGFKQRRFALLTAVSLFCVSCLIFFRLGGDFIPQLKEGDMMITVVRDSNISLSKSTEMQKKMETFLRGFKEVEYVFSRTGTTEVANDPMGIYMSDTFVILKKDSIDSLIREKNWNEFIERLRVRLNDEFPEDEISIGQPVEARFNELLEGSRADITFRILGNDLETLILLQNAAEENLKSIDGVGDVELDPILALRHGKVLDFKPDYDRILRYGITIQDFNNTYNAYLSGRSVGNYYENDKKFPIVVKLAEEYRESLSDLSQLPIGTLDLGAVSMREVSNYTLEKKVMTISRSNGRRYAAISINLENRDMESFVKEAKEKINSNLSIPNNYQVFWGGQFKNLEKAKSKLAIVVPVTLFAIFFLLLKSLNSYKQAILVYLSIPFATTGGIFALYLRGMNFSISAAIGFIALSGIAILNGVVKIHNINQLRKSGMSLKEAVQEAAVSRLRPVLMTALVASLGFIPMAIGEGLGAEVQMPLATVVIGGLVSSTLLTLFLLPVFYEWLEED
ncbi:MULTISPECIES: efflux RND transporter permease subunit [Leptospira]|uniref:CusA/CzcA family heavy metal efflux RND transporter n=2 Tax=Leptospira TaxID=171 RepID=A0AAW5VPB0_9LEPT|nr:MULTISPECIES: CusA/CzcA family heavy metal efflux RND transporter [Leptospira]MCG6140581.1 CusA/CzcA family heavy metal efflux RND transporter [Leptospira mtsangambouensis]MCG6144551.1 CusA/CzcA family heavy metal efflux RND transporter [Leptospira bandrabouensis]MCG6150440.1 CusA/CzcA family heavy metal efflux RND transporter [Leptospira bandrabouensis]MCG6160212.1 CusA/CzcA family heavy metal efflux RND transporter [Leptospira bandrabouensis]MCG6164145.1 CusA/CzcA family heavy metal efflu